jgi:hypothetical protein
MTDPDILGDAQARSPGILRLGRRNHTQGGTTRIGIAARGRHPFRTACGLRLFSISPLGFPFRATILEWPDSQGKTLPGSFSIRSAGPFRPARESPWESC